jgi:hypothetical protein
VLKLFFFFFVARRPALYILHPVSSAFLHGWRKPKNTQPHGTLK